ncbi:MAG: hypothetical protein IJ725_04590 [Ruminococcus sp.]|nr:hypothetical protein [Ruminococcus sp.]
MDMNLYKQTLDSIRISDEAIEKALTNLREKDTVGKVEMTKTKRRFNIKAGSAIAACLVMIVAFSAIFGSIGKSSFVIKADAAEVTKDSFVTAGTLQVNGDGLTYKVNDKKALEGEVHFLCNLSVDGDNIDTVSYSVENGAIEMLETDTIISYKGKSYDFHGSGGEADDIPFTYYEEATIKYADQNKNKNVMTFCFYSDDVVNLTKTYNRLADLCPDDDLLWVDSTDTKAVEKAKANFYSAIIGNSTITIKITKNDGTTESKKLAVGNIKCNAEAEYQSIEDENGVTVEGEAYDLTVTAGVKELDN